MFIRKKKELRLMLNFKKQKLMKITIVTLLIFCFFFSYGNTKRFEVSPNESVNQYEYIEINPLEISKEKQVLPEDKETGKVTYEEIVQVKDVNADILYSRGLEWFARTFNSANSVIQMKDEKLHKLIGKGAIGVSLRGHPQGFFKYTISFESRNERFKYSITDIYHENYNGAEGGAIVNNKPQCGTFLMTKKEWEKLKEQAENNLNQLVVSLKTFVIENATNEEDW